MAGYLNLLNLFLLSIAGWLVRNLITPNFSNWGGGWFYPLGDVVTFRVWGHFDVISFRLLSK